MRTRGFIWLSGAQLDRSRCGQFRRSVRVNRRRWCSARSCEAHHGRKKRQEGPDCLDQRWHTEDRDHALDVVGEHVQGHLGGDVAQRFHLEVRRAHPSLDGAEGMLHRGATNDHRIGSLIQPLLNAIKYGLAFPTSDAALLARRAMLLEKAGFKCTGSRPQVHPSTVSDSLDFCLDDLWGVKESRQRKWLYYMVFLVTAASYALGNWGCIELAAVKGKAEGLR